MKGFVPYVFCLVVATCVVACHNRHDYTNRSASHINVDGEIDNIQLELNQTNKFPRHLDLLQFYDKLAFLKKLKNLLNQYIGKVLKDKLNISQRPFPAEPPTTVNIITTTNQEMTTEDGGDTSTLMPTSTIYPNKSEPLPCYQENDLAIVVDASGSVGPENYKTSLQFAARLLSSWKQYEKNGVSAAVYASSVLPVFSFDEAAQLDSVGVEMAILAAQYIATGTASHLALDWALNEHASNNSTVEKNVVFLTDGFSNYPQLTIEAAHRLAIQRIRVFAIGVGPAANQEELLQIANNKTTHVFNTDTFMDLLDLLRPVSQIICT